MSSQPDARQAPRGDEREPVVDHVLDAVREYRTVQDLDRFVGRIQSFLARDDLDTISRDSLYELAPNWLAKAVDGPGEMAAAEIAADFLVQKAVTWESVAILTGVEIPAGEELVFGSITLFRFDQKTLQQTEESLYAPGNEVEILRKHFSDASCCRFAAKHHPEDMAGARAKAMEQISRRVAVLRLGLRAAVDIADEPIPIDVLPDCVLLRPGNAAQWHIREWVGPGQMQLDAPTRQTIRLFYSDQLDTGVGLTGTQIGRKDRGRNRPTAVSLAKLLSEVRLLMGIAEGERVILSKFLRYMTALERLLAHQEDDAKSITHRLALRGSVLYAPELVPGRFESIEAVAPMKIAFLYGLRSISHHQGNQEVQQQDLNALRILCHSCFFASLQFLRNRPGATVADYLALLNCCEEILVLLQKSESLAAIRDRYRQLLKAEYGDATMHEGIALLEMRGLIRWRDLSLTERGKALSNYALGPS